ncbi:MAG TPA: protein kinase [Candidatus Binatia bacterium]|nr:protein kinase [Candidatus Binatia bacterium]
MIGRKLSHYQVLERLGAGGMGEVYRAHDSRLERDVAVKVLPPNVLTDEEARRQFRREALALSRLNHPHIATVYDFDTDQGIDFLVMELVPGESLADHLKREPLPEAEIARLGSQIAEALEAAHEQGVIHRDLKPSNIMVTPKGQTKVVDFGLAKRLQEKVGHTLATASSGIQGVVGTLPYMAPEQLASGVIDARTDLYALGAVLYEMTTGRRPFEKDRIETLMFEILHGVPRPAGSLRGDISQDLDRLIESCLRKEAGERPASAVAVIQTLRAIGRPGSHGGNGESVREALPSLAVLPFENVSRDPAQEYFADGMTEALISELARLKALRVISRTSAMRYKGSQKALPEIARELNVSAVLEGSALLVGKRVRISAQLISARSDETLWADRYDGDLEDVLDLQSRVAEAVAKEIQVHVTPKEAKRLAKRQAAVNPEAHVEYLKGRHTAAATSPQAIELSLRYYDRALKLDPTFAPTWAGIAHCQVVRAERGMAPPSEAAPLARAAALKALELDDSLADAYTALGEVAILDHDLPAAIRNLEHSIDLNPQPAAYTALGGIFYCTERHREAQEAMLAALQLDPVSMIIHTAVGDAYYYAREYERSLVYYQKAVEIDPRFDGAHTDLARSLEAVGRFEESRREYEEGRRLSGGVAGPHFGIAHLEISMGNLEEARRQLEELTAARSRRVVSAWGIAALHARLGEVDEAFRWLDAAVQEKATGLIFLRVHPRLDGIRQDPRYGALVRKLRLDAGG